MSKIYVNTNFGSEYKIIKDKNQYCVLTKPIGGQEDDWEVIGGSVGMPESIFKTKKSARLFIKKISKSHITEDAFWKILKRMQYT